MRINVLNGYYYKIINHSKNLHNYTINYTYYYCVIITKTKIMDYP